MFPYIIQIAYPCYKRPYIETIYGSETDLEKAKSNIVKELLNHIGEYIDETLYNDEPSSNPIKDIYDNYYNEYYMDNKPWEASVFIDGKWTNCTSTFEEIYNKYKEEKAKDKESDSNEEEEEEEDEQLVSNEVEEEEEKK